MTHKPPRKTGFFEHYEELIGTWTRRLRNRQQAQDLAHDTFVRVLETDSATVEQPRRLSPRRTPRRQGTGNHAP